MVTKVDTILEINFLFISKLVSIIIKWFLNWYIISYQSFCY